jgi:secreted trypsin-like serine protease
MIAAAEEGVFAAAGRSGIVSGWGETDKSEVSPRLQEARVPIVARKTCNGPGSYDGRIGETLLCAGEHAGERDACGGDSGGPLSVDGRLVGLVSWGPNGCGQPFRYGMYARVAKLHGWVTKCIDEPATCN